MTEIRPNICAISRNVAGLNPLINEKDTEVRSQTKLNSMLHLREPHREKKILKCLKQNKRQRYISQTKRKEG